MIADDRTIYFVLEDLDTPELPGNGRRATGGAVDGCGFESGQRPRCGVPVGDEFVEHRPHGDRATVFNRLCISVVHDYPRGYSIKI